MSPLINCIDIITSFTRLVNKFSDMNLLKIYKNLNMNIREKQQILRYEIDVYDDVLFCNNRRPRVVDVKTSQIWSERCPFSVLLISSILCHKM